MVIFKGKNDKNGFFHVTKIFSDIFNTFFEIYASDYPQKIVFRLFYQANQTKTWMGRGAPEPCKNYLKSIFDHFLD